MRSGRFRPWQWSPFGANRTRVRVAVGMGVLCGMVAAAAVSHGQTSVGVLKVRLGGDAAETRIVVELDRPAHGRLITSGVGDPPRIALALAHVDAPGEMRGQGAGLVKSWSVESADGGAELKLDLVRTAHVRRRFLLPPADGAPVYRYVMDIADDSGQPVAALRRPERIAAAERYRPVHIVAPLQPTEPTRKVVVIDAGHGGKDSGALGSNTREKDDTLAAAHALRDRLEQTGRYKVVMTRDTDAFIPLETRVQIARRANADLFISLHADSIGIQGDATRGASVYTLSERGADRTAKGLFGKSDWFMNVNLPGQDSATKRILLDLTQRQNVNRSSTFAEILLDKIAPTTTLLRRSHRDANLMVLLAPDVPAVLMEMGFITNPEDERALADPDHRARVMGAVADAIDGYFAEEARYAMR